MKQGKVTWCHGVVHSGHATKEGQHMRRGELSGSQGMQSVQADRGSKA